MNNEDEQFTFEFDSILIDETEAGVEVEYQFAQGAVKWDDREIPLMSSDRKHLIGIIDGLYRESDGTIRGHIRADDRLKKLIEDNSVRNYSFGWSMCEIRQDPENGRILNGRLRAMTNPIINRGRPE